MTSTCRTLRLAVFIAAALVATSCASTSRNSLINEFLDDRTGVTVRSNSIPLLLYRNDSARAAYARNYLNIGPIEVNRGGDDQYFLWMGAWNTMQIGEPLAEVNGFDTITIFVDGEAMSLDLAGLTIESIGTSRPVYVKAVASATDAYYRVTMDQIRLIAEAKDVRLKTSGHAPREFSLWNNQKAARQSFVAFVRAANF